MKEFSVLMAVYHREEPEFLVQALESVFSQVPSAADVVLVKDGPLPEALESVIARFQRLHSELNVVALPVNSGLGKALNFGLRHCRFDIVARMDSDDICMPERFEKQLKIFTTMPEISVVGSWVGEFYENPQVVNKVKKLPSSSDEINRYFARRCPVNHPSVMFRKSAVEAVGGYNQRFVQEDYYLWGRLISNGALFYNIPEVLVNMRAGNGLFARRGGWKYAWSEISLQMEFVRMRLIRVDTFFRNVFLRLSVRLMPNFMREYVYKTFLR